MDYEQTKEVKRVINIDLVNLLLEKGFKLKYVNKGKDYKTKAIRLYFFFEYSEKLQYEIDSFMLELKHSRKQ